MVPGISSPPPPPPPKELLFILQSPDEQGPHCAAGPTSVNQLRASKGTSWVLTAHGAGRGRRVPGTRLGPLALPPVTAFATPFPRKRENSLQEDRGSFVTTPTAELSSQEETLLGSFLDWSLDYCSGYEGDQESEGEKEGDGERRAAGGPGQGCGSSCPGSPGEQSTRHCGPQGGQAVAQLDMYCQEGCTGQGQNRPTCVHDKIFLEHPVPCAPRSPAGSCASGVPPGQAAEGSVPMSGQPSADRGKGTRGPGLRPCLWIFLVACFCVHSGLSIRWPSVSCPLFLFPMSHGCHPELGGHTSPLTS